LLQVARLADPDPQRTRLREALASNDRRALQDAAASADIARLPAVTLSLLGHALAQDKEARGQAEAFLRGAQQQHPNDFWLNDNLCAFFDEVQPPQVEEVLRFAAVAVALRPDCPGAHLNLGAALAERGMLDQAIAEFRAAILLRKESPEAQDNLGIALSRKGAPDQAIAELRAAIDINSQYAKAYHDLGVVLDGGGQVDTAIDAYRQAIAIDPRYAMAYYGLGNSLYRKGQVGKAIEAYRQAIAIDPKYAMAYRNLGVALRQTGQVDEAIDAYRQAIAIDPKYARAYYNVGIALQQRGQVDGASDAYRQAIKFQPDFAEAHCNLGNLLVPLGRFREAVEELRRGHELGVRDPRWRYPSAQWLRTAEQLVALDNKLPKLLSGEAQPADNAERLSVARLCQQPCKRLYAASARFYTDAFAKQRQLANDLNAQHRFNAARAASLAGTGQGNDAGGSEERERARLRRQALAWLRADLVVYPRLADKGPTQARALVQQRLANWQHETDLGGVRGAAVAKLPETERDGWRKLWADVEKLLASARMSEKEGGKADAKRPAAAGHQTGP
jgi:tetratricopeptide (TPR) repeat protein